MSSYNKVITTINNITSDYTYIPIDNEFMVIDTSNNRLGINVVNPSESIEISGGNIKCNKLYANDLCFNNITLNNLQQLFSKFNELLTVLDNSSNIIADISFIDLSVNI